MDTRTLSGLAQLLGAQHPHRVYEIGSRNINGSVRSLFREAEQYFGVDLLAGRDVDRVDNGLTAEPPFEPDCVVCCEVLEHTPHARALVERMASVVAPDGIVLISCAGLQRDLHGIDGQLLQPNEFYQGIDHLALTAWLRDAGLVQLQLTLAHLPSTDPHVEGAHDIYIMAHKPRPTKLVAAAPPAKTPGVTPMTIVEVSAEIPVEELAARIQRTRAQHDDVLQAYHEVWYNAPHTWHYTHFLGVGVMKGPNDLWAYQELITEHRPRTIIETGTYTGGSALWFAFLMDMLQIDGHVYTIDFEDHRECDHPRITFLGGNSVDPQLVASIVEELEPGPRLVVLDSDHSADHVRRELELYAPLCHPGDWLVVEDTNIAWTPDANGEHGDRGARGGLSDYFDAHPGEWRQDLLLERWLLTMNPGGWLQRIAKCPHGQ